MKKEKKLLNKIMHALTIPEDEVFWKAEVAGNKLTALVMLMMSGVLVVVYVLRYVGFFTINKKIINVLVIQGLFELIIPAIICLKFKGEKTWLKIVLLTEFTVVLSRIDAALTFIVPILIVFPVILSVRYFSSKLTKFIAIFTTVVFSISSIYGCYHGVLNVSNVPLEESGVINIINGSITESVIAHGYDVKEYVIDTLRFYYTPKMLIYAVIGTLCVMIAEAGKNMILQQEKTTRSNERMSTELDLASRIQERLLPSIFPPYPERKEFDIYASMTPAREVGGDFYDFFLIDDDHLMIEIADVSGKGVPASLFMAITKSMLLDHVKMGQSPAEAFTSINSTLCNKNETGMFVTAWMAIVEISSGKVTYVNAGHNPPLIYKNGHFEFLKCKPGFVLGGLDGIQYKQFELQLQPNDKLLLYTDGVTEATNSNNELYGNDRLIEFCNNNTDKNCKDIIPMLLQQLEQFAGDQQQFDDITILAFNYVGNKEKEYDADLSMLHTFLDEVEKVMDENQANFKYIMPVQVACEEVFTNIATYAYPNQKGKLYSTIDFEDDDIVITFKDNGIEFNPLEAGQPDLSSSAEERNIGGLGIYMVKKTFDDIKYEYKDKMNILTLRKKVKNV